MRTETIIAVLEVCLRAQIERPDLPIFPPHIRELMRRLPQ